MREVIGAGLGPQVSFVGPFGVGKTTAVVTVCTTKVVMTEVFSSTAHAAPGKHAKATTTVGLEIGEWTAPDGTEVCVVGTPGQERFDMVRRSAMPRSSAVVLWLYGDHAAALEDAQLWLEFVMKEVPARKLVVALTRTDEAVDSDVVRGVRAILDEMDVEIPLVTADPRDAESVNGVMQAALDRSRPRQAVRS